MSFDVTERICSHLTVEGVPPAHCKSAPIPDTELFQCFGLHKKIAKIQKTKRENPEIQSSFGKVFNQLSFKVKMPHWSEYELIV